MTLCCTVVPLLVAVFLFTAGEATNDPCRYRHFEMESCIDDGYMNFGQLDDPSYQQQMCSSLEPVTESCIKQNRDQCPNIPTFQGYSGQTVDDLLTAYRRLCSGRQSNRRRGQACSAASQGEFRENMRRCNRFLEVNLREDQMCGPLRNVVDCMGEQERQYRRCSWYTPTVRRQVRLAAAYMRAIGAVKHRCTS